MDKVGCAISNSTHLQKLKVCWFDSAMQPELMTSFFLHLAQNRSIVHLVVDSVDHSIVDIFAILAPFFELNHNLRCIEIRHGSSFTVVIPSFILALQRQKSNHLESIKLAHIELKDDGLTELINALQAMPGLNILSELCLEYNRIENEGCYKLGELLKNPSSGIRHLDLQHNFMDDMGISHLVGALFQNTTVKSLDLSFLRRLTSTSWHTLSGFLKTPQCMLESVYLGGTVVSMMKVLQTLETPLPPTKH